MMLTGCVSNTTPSPNKDQLSVDREKSVRNQRFSDPLSAADNMSNFAQEILALFVDFPLLGSAKSKKKFLIE